MKKTENFKEMTPGQLRTSNGGGFAYDVGRVLRFIGVSAFGNPIGVSYAIVDWEVNALINEDSNG